MKENREDLLLMVPVVCDFSSWVLFSPLDVGSPQIVHLCGEFYSQYFNIPFLGRFVFYGLIHNDVILVVVISSLKTKGSHEEKASERKTHTQFLRTVIK